MKKTLLVLFLFASLIGNGVALAQSFSLQAGDTVYHTATAGNNSIYNKITNTSASNINVTWKVTGHDFPTSWMGDNASFGICDNVLCYFNNGSNNLLGGSTQMTNDITPGGESDFHLVIDLDDAVSGTHWVRVNMRTDNFTMKNPVFVITKGTTGLTSVTRSDDGIAIYPNPARDYVNVLFDPSDDVRTISVHNMIGKLVSVYKVTAASAKLEISELPAGVYFIRLADAQGKIVGTRKFTHQ